MQMQRFLVILGLVLLAAGLFWPWLSRLGLGRLPGDIHIQGQSTSITIPLTTSILISLALSLVLWLVSR